MAKLVCPVTGVVVEVADPQAVERMKKGGFTDVRAAASTSTKAVKNESKSSKNV